MEIRLTPKRRREIYMKVVENLEKGIGDRYLCGQLSNFHNTSLRSTINSFPEFALFEPTYEEKEEERTNGNLVWWRISHEIPRSIAIRQTCMLLCAEMTKSSRTITTI